MTPDLGMAERVAKALSQGFEGFVARRQRFDGPNPLLAAVKQSFQSTPP